MHIRIETGFESRYRLKAAALYFEAFRAKLSPVFGTVHDAVTLLAGHLQPNRALAAFHGRQLVGMVGFHHAGSQFVNLRPLPFIRQFGPFRGLCRYALAGILTRSPQAGELLLDGIVVDAAKRGNGIGSALLVALSEFASANHYRALRLDVVDTNPAARRLYERHGFEPVTTRQVPFLASFGFTGVTTMRKSLA
jgi:ribosomal protein S18 acetylase RimI-like enzyme